MQPDDSGNINVVGGTEIAMGLYYVDELATDLWASIDSAVNAATDLATVNCTVNPVTPDLSLYRTRFSYSYLSAIIGSTLVARRAGK